MKINTADINKEVRNMSLPGNTRRDFLKAAAVGGSNAGRNTRSNSMAFKKLLNH